MFQPAYLDLVENGELAGRVEEAYERLRNCEFCPQACRKDRRNGKLGVCQTGELARVASYGPHMGEEAPLSGRRGSGTIFFSRCNLHCQYCQNYEISQFSSGEETSPENLATYMLELQALGCHNINLVSPSHVVPQILAAVLIAARAGLRLPLVFNTGGYDALPTLALLDGVVDIYMPDMKYSSAQTGLHYSKIRNYPQHNQAAVREMYRQVGDLQLDDQGIARRGLLVRHLVLPHGLAGTPEIVHFLAQEISRNTYLNLMDQYHPVYHVTSLPNRFLKLKRRITSAEYAEALQCALDAGLTRLDPENRRFFLR